MQSSWHCFRSMFVRVQGTTDRQREGRKAAQKGAGYSGKAPVQASGPGRQGDCEERYTRRAREGARGYKEKRQQDGYGRLAGEAISQGVMAASRDHLCEGTAFSTCHSVCYVSHGWLFDTAVSCTASSFQPSIACYGMTSVMICKSCIYC